MIPALRAPAACVALFAVACGASRASAADTAGDGSDPATVPSGQAGAASLATPSTTPLVLLVQGDALLASRPNLAEDPRDAPAGPALRLRRLRVGDDGAIGDFRLRLLLEEEADTAAGTPFTPLSGGRLAFGGSVRVTEAYVAWAAYRAFQVEAGSLRVPFSLSRQVDEGDLRLPERPAFAEAFLADYRVGAALGGDLGEIIYRAAVMSPDPVLDSQLFSHGVLVAGRLVAEPLGPVGLTPWRRAESDPWYGWFRFAAGLSVLYGTLAAPRTLALDPDFTAQWRSFVVTAEYLFLVRYADGVTTVPGSTEQGAALEPGVTLLGRRLDLVARGSWERAASVNVWAVGAGLTAYAPDPRFRLNAGFERRWTQPAAPDSDGGSYWAIVRLAIVVN
jgi:hypothetical protein